MVTFEFVSLLFYVFVLFLIFCVFQYILERIAFVDVGVIWFVFEFCLFALYLCLTYASLSVSTLFENVCVRFLVISTFVLCQLVSL